MKRVIVVQHDPRWGQAFVTASREVTGAMGENLVAIHHIGSTAIPGIWAKPVIDMLAVVADIGAVDSCGAAMESLGYEVMGEFGIAGRRYFRRNDEKGVRTHQVHAFASGSHDVERHLAFRDFMRAHPDIAREYGELKRGLAERFPDDIESYMDGKDGFIKEMQARAMVWKEEAAEQ